MTAQVVYVIGWAVCYVLVARWTVREHAREFPQLKWDVGDTVFAVCWSPFVALFWPALVIGVPLGRGFKSLAARSVHKVFVSYEERVTSGSHPAGGDA